VQAEGVIEKGRKERKERCKAHFRRWRIEQNGRGIVLEGEEREAPEGKKEGSRRKTLLRSRLH